MKLLDAVMTLILLALLPVTVSMYSVPGASGELVVHMLDVGQGDAMLIESPSGNQMLIDAGKPGTLLKPLQEKMDITDRYIDVLLLTHPDADHIGGVPELLERYEVGVMLTAPAGCAKELCNIINDLALRFDIATRTVQLGSQIDLGAGATFDVLYPVVESEEGNNDTSVIGVLSYGESSMLLSGDASKRIEHYLIDTWGEHLDVDVLKVGHHGSKTSAAKELIEVTTPQYALISAGFNNQYGHPHPEVLERVAHATEEIFETAEWGTVTLTSDGVSWVKEQ